MLHFLWNLSALFVTLGILIIVHEFGHFWVARRCGVTVTRVSIGFGHVLWRKFDKSGTEYVISAIPFGGYIQMLDEKFLVDKTHLSNTFNHKKVWQKALIIIAGPICNFLLAIMLFWLIFMLGISSISSRPIISKIQPNSIMAQAKIKNCMEIISVDGVKTPDWTSFILQIKNHNTNNNTLIQIQHLGSSHIENIFIKIPNFPKNATYNDILVKLGIIPMVKRIEAIIKEIKEKSAAAKAGLQLGDKIIFIDDKPVNNVYGVISTIRNNPGIALPIIIERKGNIINKKIIIENKQVADGKLEGIAGIRIQIINLSTVSNFEQIVSKLDPIKSFIQACKHTWYIIKTIVNRLSQLVTKSMFLTLSKLSGPIGIATNAGLLANYGIMYYLMFLALININIGIMNLLPFTILDGGHLLLLFLEKISGKNRSEKIYKWCNTISFIVLMIVICIGIFNDICILHKNIF